MGTPRAAELSGARASRLSTFAAGIEFFSKSLNSGVVYFNVSTMLASRESPSRAARLPTGPDAPREDR